MGECMNDLFQSIEEAKEERQAIQMADGITTTADELHRCEITAVILQCYPDGEKAKEYFELVEKKRGHLAAQRLRDDVRAEWKKQLAEARAA